LKRFQDFKNNRYPRPRPPQFHQALTRYACLPARLRTIEKTILLRSRAGRVNTVGFWIRPKIRERKTTSGRLSMTG